MKYVDFYLMTHWGGVDLLPTIRLHICYLYPTFTFSFWVFRFDLKIPKPIPEWLYNYVWNPLVNFENPFKKENVEDEEDEL